MNLPAWAQDQIPVDMAGAAAVLGIARRTLVDVIRVHQHYERRGTRKVFYPEHIALLREAISCQSGGQAAKGYGSNSASGASGMPLEAMPESAYEKALALATKGGRQNSKPPMKRASGTVIPMARKPSEPSRKLP